MWTVRQKTLEIEDIAVWPYVFGVLPHACPGYLIDPSRLTRSMCASERYHGRLASKLNYRFKRHA